MVVRRVEGKCRPGIVALELAAVLPLLLMMVAGLLDTARLIEVKQVLLTAAREGGRQAAAARLTSAEVKHVVRTFMRKAGYPVAHLNITLENLTSASVEPHVAAQFDRYQIRLTIPYGDIRVGNVRFLIRDDALISAEAIWHSLKDKPYPNPPDPAIE